MDNAKNTPDLLPCPLCGGKPYLVNVAMVGCTYVVCTNCRLQTDDGSAERVVAHWNTRATPAREAAEDLVGAIKAALAVQTIELNPSNYSHDDACQLNNEMIEVWQILTAALSRAKGGL